MSHLFEGNMASEVWNIALSEIRNGKNCRIQSGRGGETREIDQVLFTIRDPRQRWVVTRQPPLNPAFAIAEVVWILNGRKDSAFLNFWNSQLPKYAGSGDEYHGAYGFRLRHHFGIDQLEQAYLTLKHNIDTRQAVLQIWDPKIDFPDEHGQPVSQDIPCNIMALLKIRDGKLNWTQIVRSNDLYKGVPYNFIQFTSLQEVMAGWLSVEPGPYNQLSDSLHVYDGDFEDVATDLIVDVEQNSDSLTFPKEISERAFARLAQCIDIMLNPDLSQKELYSIIEQYDFPVAFQNMLLVVASEAARRKRWLDIAQKLMHLCSNPVLIQVWERWLTRFKPQ